MKYIITERQLKLIKEETDISNFIESIKSSVNLSFPYYMVNDDFERALKFANGRPFIIEGNLNLKPAKVITLGSLVGVEGGLDLGFSKTIKDLGNLQYVLGYLDLGRTNIESLGKLKYVSGSLDLRRTPLSGKTTEEEIRNMPNLTIGGGIYL